MCVVYLLSSKTEANKDHGRMVISKDKEKIQSVPFTELTQVVASRGAHLTNAILYEFMLRHIPVSFVDGRGHIVGQLDSSEYQLQRLSAQQEYLRDPEHCLRLSREIVQQKIKAQKDLIQDYAYSLKSPDLRKNAKMLDQYSQDCLRAESIESLRGIEGNAAKTYFSCFSYILDQTEWPWNGRQQHPAHDPVNALLNYGYACLEREVRLAVIGNSLDCRLGFFHSNNGRKDSLIYDLMEPFRQPVIDRLILKMLKCKMYKQTDFTITGDGCRICDTARQKWFTQYEQYLDKPAKSCGNLSPRDLMREQIAQFSQRIYTQAA